MEFSILIETKSIGVSLNDLLLAEASSALLLEYERVLKKVVRSVSGFRARRSPG